MNHQVFDQVSRLLGQAGTRRTALGTLVGAGALGMRTADASQHRHNKRRKRRKQQNPFSNLRNCPNPGPGQDLSRCNFAGHDLRGKNLSGADLSGALFANANLCSANLSGTRLEQTDFTLAVLTRADLRGTDLSEAILDDTAICQTWLPNGVLDSSHCPRDDSDICCSDADCGEGIRCERGWCGGPPPQAGACKAMGDVCTFGATPCCGYGNPKRSVCDETWAILLSTCQMKCDGDNDCTKALGTPDVFCRAGANCFPFDKCCFRKHTRNPQECSSGSSCLVSQTVYECCLSSDTTCSPVGFGCV